jgi:hypothetical protein
VTERAAGELNHRKHALVRMAPGSVLEPGIYLYFLLHVPAFRRSCFLLGGG